MTNRTKKHILKTAKDSVNQKFEAKIEQMHEQVSLLHASNGHLNDDGLISHEADAECSICLKIHKSFYVDLLDSYFQIYQISQ